MHARAAHGDSVDEMDVVLVRDPVCGMEVDPATSRHRADRLGRWRVPSQL